MKKIELPIASDYVSSWTIVDAIRELFQNAIDATADGSQWSWEYSEHEQTLRITSLNASLSTATLLLGKSSKVGDSKTIGQFGEGYKLATLVLLRNDKKVVFKNAGTGEIWCPRFISSKRFNCKVLGFFIEKEYAIGKDLTVEVHGITEQEWEEQIVPSNLYLRNDYKIVAETPVGQVLDLKGLVFINGLFVCSYDEYHYGYNFKPEQLKLDRDRKLASDFDLEWLASKIWVISNEYKLISELASKNAADVKYVEYNAYQQRDTYTAACSDAYFSFKEEHGDKAVPVTAQYELEQVPAGYKGIIVPEVYKTMIVKSQEYEEPKVEPKLSLYERFKTWYEDYLDSEVIGEEAEKEFMILLRELKEKEADIF